MNQLMKSAACLLTSASMALYPYHAAFGANPEPNDRDAMDRKIAELRGVSAQLRDTLKRERFDPEARVEAADYDLNALVAFVRDEIVFQPYAGTLKGAAGTLRSGAGNSLDQSLLLADMLNSAGFDARIVRTDLDEPQARELLEAIGNAPEPASTDYVVDNVAELFGGVEEDPGDPAPPDESEFFADTQRHTGQLLDALAEAGVELSPRDVTERLLETVRPYFWVQVREGPSGPWQNVHPSFGEATAPDDLEPLEFFANAIPEELQHRIEMTAWIEQWLGGTVERHAIMSPWSAPVANLHGWPIRFQNVPDGATGDHGGDFEQVFALTRTLSPAMGKASPDGAMAFDLQGRVIDPLALAASPAAGIIKTVGDTFAEATEGLADREDGAPAMALHSMYLEFTMHRPGGDSETRRRYVLPPRDNYDAPDEEVLRQLVTGYTYMVSTGEPSEDFILDQYIEGSMSDLDWLKYLVLSEQAPDSSSGLPEDPPSAVSTLMQLASMERLPANPGTVRFRGEPVLAGFRDGLRDTRTAFSEVDVVWNPMEALRREGDRWMSAPKDVVTAGVWDTVLEALPLAGTVNDESRVSSTPRIFDLAEAQGIELRVLQPGNTDDFGLDGLSLDAQTRLFVQRDLDNGYAVVIPRNKPDSSTMLGWWRVRPDSGETLGMLDDGYGATATEYLILLTVTVLSMFALKKRLTYEECEEESGMVARLCCAHKKFKEEMLNESDADKALEKTSDGQTYLLCGN